MKLIRSAVVAAAALALTLSACGDDDDDAAIDTPSTTEAATATTVAVTGPSIEATAPDTTPAGQPVVVTVKVDGLTLVKADGDTSGNTGHLHVFIDREPTASGQPIPVEAGIIHSAAASIPVPGLTAGKHTLHVVAGDGTHTPFEPRVEDKLTVTVA